jgi:tetratricopeptide (TPR) repeat protein
MDARVPAQDEAAKGWSVTRGWREFRARRALAAGSNMAVRGDYDGALASLEAAARTAPPHSPIIERARDVGAEVLSRAGRHREAAVWLEDLLRDRPDSAGHWRRLARVLKAAGDRKGEIKAWRRVLELDPADYQAHKHLAAIFTASGHPSKAATHLRALVQATPKDPTSWKRLGLALQAAGRTREALGAWTRVAELDPGDRLAHHQCLELIEACGEPEKALPHLWALAQGEADDPGAWRALARRILELGDPNRQILAWERLRAIAPDDFRIRSNLARLLFSQGRIAEGVRHARASAERAGDAQAWKSLARRYRQLGDVEGEIECWRRAVGIDPDHAVAHVRLYRIFEAAGRKADMVPHLAFMAKDGDPSSRDRLIACLCDLDRRSEALPYLEAAAEETPDSQSSWKRLARCQQETGDPEAAVRSWRKVLSLDAAEVESLERLEEIERRIVLEGRSPGSTVTITVLGNCQAHGVSQCLRRLLPDADVTGIVWNEVDSSEHAEQIARRLEGQDIVIVQPTDKGYHGALRTELLRPRVKRMELFPSFHFTGFHPDLLWMPKEALRRGRRHRFGTWHSALVLAAFTRGAPQVEAADLFNAYIYGVLGYFDEFAKAERYHIDAAAELGFDIEAELDLWMAGGAFVHVPNHPSIDVFWSLARMICARLGLETAQGQDPPADRLAALARWPVYPEIARRLGVKGSLTFESPGGLEPAAGLEEMIDELYRGYAEADPRALRTPRIQRMVETLRAEGV